MDSGLIQKTSIVHCTYLGYMSRGIIFKKFFFLSEDFFIFTNSVDPDEMQHFAAFHLSLYCLQKYWFRGFPRIQRDKE